jgi:mono/diheme cytochrome c family protein
MAGTVGPDNSLQGAWLIVHKDEDEYLKQFFNPETVAVVFPPTDPVALGEAILRSGKYPCATCHTETNLGWTGNIGPSLNGIADRTQRLAATGLPDMQTYLSHSIRHSQEYLVPGYGPLMPVFNPNPDQPNYLPDSDLNAIVAYLLTQHQ